jgi:xyloglucan:xyloglucosyl transferase
MGCPHLGFLLMVCCFLHALLASASHGNLPIMAFDEGYTQLFGDDHLVVHKDGKTVHLSLDERTGCLLLLNGLVCYMRLIVGAFD